MAELEITLGEAIGREIARRIRLITLANGQRISSASVTRTDRNPAEADPMPFVTIQEASDRYRMVQVGGKTTVDAEIPIVVAVDRAVDEEKPRALRDLWLRIYRALMFDEGVCTAKLGRLVTSIEPMDFLPAIPGAESPRVTGRFGFRVTYQFPTADPTAIPSDFREVNPW